MGTLFKRVIVVLCLLSVTVFLPLSPLPKVANAFPADMTVLKYGMSNALVMQLQTMLGEHGYYTGNIDGDFGEGTRQALISFQIDHQLVPDGVAGLQTMTILREMAIQPSRDQAPNRIAKQITALARQLRNTPYAWGGSSPGGFDCSGYIYYLFHYFHLELPRMADEQYEVGIPVKRTELQEGDLVYFSTYMPGPSHVGLYIGENAFIHASSAAGKVIITPLNSDYYQANYLGARRVIKGF